MGDPVFIRTRTRVSRWAQRAGGFWVCYDESYVDVRIFEPPSRAPEPTPDPGEPSP